MARTPRRLRLSGLYTVEAKNYDDAVSIAKGCPHINIRVASRSARSISDLEDSTGIQVHVSTSMAGRSVHPLLPPIRVETFELMLVRPEAPNDPRSRDHSTISDFPVAGDRDRHAPRPGGRSWRSSVRPPRFARRAPTSPHDVTVLRRIRSPTSPHPPRTRRAHRERLTVTPRRRQASGAVDLPVQRHASICAKPTIGEETGQRVLERARLMARLEEQNVGERDETREAHRRQSRSRACHRARATGEELEACQVIGVRDDTQEHAPRRGCVDPFDEAHASLVARHDHGDACRPVIEERIVARVPRAEMSSVAARKRAICGGAGAWRSERCA